MFGKEVPTRDAAALLLEEGFHWHSLGMVREMVLVLIRRQPGEREGERESESEDNGIEPRWCPPKILNHKHRLYPKNE